MQPLRLVAIAAITACLTGCASGSVSTSSSPSPSPASLQSSWKAQAQALGSALSVLNAGPLSWTYEPRGDIAPDKTGTGGTVFARILAVRDGGRSITFDAEQLFVGPAAWAQEARDYGHPFYVTAIYTRNRYRHRQTLRLAPECVIIVQTSQPSDLQSSLMTAVTPAEFARRFSSLSHLFWISIGSKAPAQVWDLVNEYSP